MNRRILRLHRFGLIAWLVLAMLPQATWADEAFWREGRPGPAPGRPDSFADLASELSPAVVFLEVTKPADPIAEQLDGLRERLGPFGPPSGLPETASGSGFVLSPDGYIATNNHVVEGASEISVRFIDGTELEAKVVGRDSQSDLALIKVVPPRALVTAPLGDSDQTRVGDWVVAIGNPYGFEHSVTVGILSAKGRSLDMSSYDDFLQTDASINPGNSGGPLIDTAGRVIGINSAIRATVTGGTTGIGFAIPINIVKSLLPQLRENGSATRGWLGVQIQEVTAPMARVFGLDRPRGALIGMVLPESPATGQLKAGDIIVRFGDAEIRRVTDLPRAVGVRAPGTEVPIEIIRDGKRQTLITKLGSLESENEAEAEPPPIELGSTEPAAPPTSLDTWGFAIEDVKPSLRQRLGLASQDLGVRISSVSPNSPASREGLQEDDIILEANRRAVRSADELTDTLSGEILVLLLQRGERTLVVTLERLGAP